MGTPRQAAEVILDSLAEAPNIRIRKMLGEYALCCDDKVVVLI